MRDLLTVEQRNTRRLAKIHKLKRENVKLGQQRTAIFNRLITLRVRDELGAVELVGLTCKLLNMSEKIGKNSSKIQRLRTLISQDKAWENRPRLLDPRKIVYVE